MVPDNFIDDEAQEFFGKVGVELGIPSKLAQALDLTVFARRVCGWQARSGFMFANRLRDFEALGEHEHQCSVDIVDAVAVTGQDIVVAHVSALPREAILDKGKSGICTCHVVARLAGQLGNDCNTSSNRRKPRPIA